MDPSRRLSLYYTFLFSLMKSLPEFEIETKSRIQKHSDNRHGLPDVGATELNVEDVWPLVDTPTVGVVDDEEGNVEKLVDTVESSENGVVEDGPDVVVKS